MHWLVAVLMLFQVCPVVGLVFMRQPNIRSLPKKAGLSASSQPITVVLSFNDDGGMASDRYRMARHVDEILANKNHVAGVVVVVNSPGGGVAEYGQLYAEMKRLRDAKIDLTVCIDTYGASGGYLMSLPANKIVAAPFSLVGSIGVVTEILNFNKLLIEHGVDPLTLTAGKYKRTVTQTGPVTEEGRQHVQDQLEAMHRAFIDVVKKYRPQIDTDKVCTGDHWYAQESMDQGLGLVDEVATSNDYLLKIRNTNSLLILSEPKPGFFSAGLAGGLERLQEHMVDTIIDRMHLSARTY